MVREKRKLKPRFKGKQKTKRNMLGKQQQTQKTYSWEKEKES